MLDREIALGRSEEAIAIARDNDVVKIESALKQTSDEDEIIRLQEEAIKLILTRHYGINEPDIKPHQEGLETQYHNFRLRLNCTYPTVLIFEAFAQSFTKADINSYISKAHRSGGIIKFRDEALQHQYRISMAGLASSSLGEALACNLGILEQVPMDSIIDYQYDNNGVPAIMAFRKINTVSCSFGVVDLGKRESLIFMMQTGKW